MSKSKSTLIFSCSPSKVTAHYADVADPASVDASLAEIISEHGKIDNLVSFHIPYIRIVLTGTGHVSRLHGKF
jgi:hypothetical protein